MYRFILLVGFLCSFFIAGAQQRVFAPLGATWHYAGVNGVTDPESPVLLFIKCTKDTLIKSKTCSKLEIKVVGNKQDTFETLEPEFVYTDSLKVYYFTKWDSAFALFIDFGTETNDYWITNFNQRNDTQKVIFTDSVQVQTRKLKRMVVNNLTLRRTDTLISGIGYTANFLPFKLRNYFPQRLNCFNDGSIFFQKDPKIACDSIDAIQIGIKDLAKDEKTLVYPNPVQQQFYLQSNSFAYADVYLTDVTGKEISVFKDHQAGLPVSTAQLLPGIYYLKIVAGNKTYRSKIIKI